MTPVPPEADAKPEVEALRRAVTQQFDQYVKLNKKIPPEILTSIAGIDDAGRLADTIAAHLPLKLEAKQSVLDLFDVAKRLEKLLELLEHEVDILQVEKRIRGRVKRQMEKSQREYYLNEQVKAIQKELGDGEEGADLEELEKKIKAAKMPKEARKKADAELKKLKLMSPMSAEATVVRNYIDTLVNLPWSKKTKIKHDLAHAEEVLNEDHYGLEKVKDRILEYLAVQQRVDKVKAPILCLVGPPGVGKTSLGQIGGARHRPQVRAHGAGRRARRGRDPRPPPHLHRLDAGQGAAEPDQGRHAQPAVPARRDRQARHGLPRRPVVGAARGARPRAEPHLQRPLRRGRLRPVRHDVRRDVELDEHPAGAARPDGSDPPVGLHRGREAQHRAALPAAQAAARTTASRTRRWTSPRARSAASSATTRAKPACARSSARSRKICRKVVKGIQLKKYDGKVVVTEENLNDFLGVRKFDFGRAEKKNQVGQVVGLAWTEVGGDLLTIESAVMPGKGNIIRTGSLGDVMKESVEAARSVVRSAARGGWASRTSCSRSATSTSTCPTAPRRRTARARASR